MKVIKYGPKYAHKAYNEMDFETLCPHCQSTFQFNIREMTPKMFDNIIESCVQCPVCNQFLYQNTLNVKFKRV